MLRFKQVGQGMVTWLSEHLSERFQLDKLPSPRRAYLHLLLIPLTVVFIWGYVELRPKGYLAEVAVFAIMVAWGLTVGRDDLRPYWRLPDGSLALAYLFAMGAYLMQVPGAWLGFQLVGSDPQGLRSETLTAAGYLDQLTHIPWIAVGEEMLKALTGLALLSLLSTLRLSLPLRLVLASLGVAAIFGAMHAVYWPAAAAVPIALSVVFELALLL